MNENNIKLIREIARTLSVDPDLAQAIATIESNCDFLAVRFEPKWVTFLNVSQYSWESRISPMTEQVLQAMSWGPLQIMGTVCREMGFKGKLVELASQPNLSIHYGCLKIKSCLERYNGSLPHAISAYNAGSAIRTIPDKGFSNQDYVNRVTAELNRLKGLASL